MIIGTGIDMTDSRRLEKIITTHGDRFKARYFTALENDLAAQQQNVLMYYTKRFAAKEACAKALKTGFRNGIRMQDIEVTNESSGRPVITLKDAALTALITQLPDNTRSSIHLSLSDEPPYAIAQVIIEAL